MFEIILLTYLAYRNSVRAKLKGVNAFTWGTITVVSVFAAMVLGMMFVVFNFCTNVVNIEQLASQDASVRLAVSKQLTESINNNFLQSFTIELFGIGGYLLVRYILDKKPNKKEPEIHWMDKMGN